MRRLLLIDRGGMFGRAVRLCRHRDLPKLRPFVSLGLELAFAVRRIIRALS